MRFFTHTSFIEYTIIVAVRDRRIYYITQNSLGIIIFKLVSFKRILQSTMHNFILLSNLIKDAIIIIQLIAY